ncbi:hypothetical protein J1N35_000917 [Gossypium stocksii]|uniref:Aminotransferase-like plant mobile domain-containing protein n=1 Tax=Gossypium stocksii TaxID=47602 RepID=A0A9D3WIZ4_9ROSI|nr:hypothetical protein J1N35_000917 [Gossypium stocksii]
MSARIQLLVEHGGGDPGEKSGSTFGLDDMNNGRNETNTRLRNGLRDQNISNDGSVHGVCSTVDDRVLEGFIHNMGKLVILEICGHLQTIGFLHASHMSGGCKLDLQLISALVERWRPERHTFHLPYDECTITLEDLALQLGLLVDGPVITRSGTVSDKVTLCLSLLGKVPITE